MTSRCQYREKLPCTDWVSEIYVSVSHPRGCGGPRHLKTKWVTNCVGPFWLLQRQLINVALISEVIEDLIKKASVTLHIKFLCPPVTSMCHVQYKNISNILLHGLYAYNGRQNTEMFSLFTNGIRNSITKMCRQSSVLTSVRQCAQYDSTVTAYLCNGLGFGKYIFHRFFALAFWKPHMSHSCFLCHLF